MSIRARAVIESVHTTGVQVVADVDSDSSGIWVQRDTAEKILDQLQLDHEVDPDGKHIAFRDGGDILFWAAADNYGFDYAVSEDCPIEAFYVTFLEDSRVTL